MAPKLSEDESGLENLGQTCYMNAVLQAVAHEEAIGPLVDYALAEDSLPILARLLGELRARGSDSYALQQRFMEELETMAISSPDAGCVAAAQRFSSKQQADSLEFLFFAGQFCWPELMHIFPMLKARDQATTNAPSFEFEIVHVHANFPNSTTPGATTSLLEMISLSDTNNTQYLDLPENFTILIDRYVFPSGTLRRDPVTFPSTSFQWPYQTLAGTESRFIITAVICHQGLDDFGHYFTFVRERNDNSRDTVTWTKYDDARREPGWRTDYIPLDAIYILFVQRVGLDKPPSQSPSTTTSQSRDERRFGAENDAAVEDVFEIERLAVLNGLTYDERMEIVHKALESDNEGIRAILRQMKEGYPGID